MARRCQKLYINWEARICPNRQAATSEGGWGTLSGEVKEGMARRARGDTSQTESPTLLCSANAGMQPHQQLATAPVVDPCQSRADTKTIPASPRGQVSNLARRNTAALGHALACKIQDLTPLCAKP